jgi:hypothetical protein
MLASYPASMVNQKQPDLGIPNRFNLTPSRFRYQPAGRCRKKRLAQIDPAKVPDARAVLEAALGKLALFEVLAERKPVA